MKIPLSYVKLDAPMDSVEPLNTTGLGTARGWKLTLDTDIGTIQGILTRGEGAGEVVKRVEFSAAKAAHWVRENWAEPIDWTQQPQHLVGGLSDIFPQPKEDPHGQESIDAAERSTRKSRTGGKPGVARTRKRSGGGRRQADGVQPEATGGDDPQS